MSPASALCPSPRPSATPAAIAMTFFSAPPISTPTTSCVPYRRKYGARKSACTRLDDLRVRRCDADGRRQLARHLDAKLGPDSTPTRTRAPNSCSTISDRRNSVSCSSPLVALTTIGVRRNKAAPPGEGPRRMPCDGMAATTRSASASASSRSAVTFRRGWKGDVGKIDRVRAPRAQVGDERRVASP